MKFQTKFIFHILTILKFCLKQSKLCKTFQWTFGIICTLVDLKRLKCEKFTRIRSVYKGKSYQLFFGKMSEPFHSRDMPFQARLLVEKMKSGKEGIDFQNDWKVITMFIGGNDLCDYCKDRVRHYLLYMHLQALLIVTNLCTPNKILFYM